MGDLSSCDETRASPNREHHTHTQPCPCMPLGSSTNMSGPVPRRHEILVTPSYMNGDKRGSPMVPARTSSPTSHASMKLTSPSHVEKVSPGFLKPHGPPSWVDLPPDVVLHLATWLDDSGLCTLGHLEKATSELLYADTLPARNWWAARMEEHFGLEAWTVNQCTSACSCQTCRTTRAKIDSRYQLPRPASGATASTVCARVHGIPVPPGVSMQVSHSTHDCLRLTTAPLVPWAFSVFDPIVILAAATPCESTMHPSSGDEGSGSGCGSGEEGACETPPCPTSAHASDDLNPVSPPWATTVPRLYGTYLDATLLQSMLEALRPCGARFLSRTLQDWDGDDGPGLDCELAWSGVVVPPLAEVGSTLTVAEILGTLHIDTVHDQIVRSMAYDEFLAFVATEATLAARDAGDMGCVCGLLPCHSSKLYTMLDNHQAMGTLLKRNAWVQASKVLFLSSERDGCRYSTFIIAVSTRSGALVCLVAHGALMEDVFHREIRRLCIALSPSEHPTFLMDWVDQDVLDQARAAQLAAALLPHAAALVWDELPDDRAMVLLPIVMRAMVTNQVLTAMHAAEYDSDIDPDTDSDMDVDAPPADSAYW